MELKGNSPKKLRSVPQILSKRSLSKKWNLSKRISKFMTHNLIKVYWLITVVGKSRNPLEKWMKTWPSMLLWLTTQNSPPKNPAAAFHRIGLHQWVATFKKVSQDLDHQSTKRWLPLKTCSKWAVNCLKRISQQLNLKFRSISIKFQKIRACNLWGIKPTMI